MGPKKRQLNTKSDSSPKKKSRKTQSARTVSRKQKNQTKEPEQSVKNVSQQPVPTDSSSSTGGVLPDEEDEEKQLKFICPFNPYDGSHYDEVLYWKLLSLNVYWRQDAEYVPDNVARVIAQIKTERSYPPPSEDEMFRIRLPMAGFPQTKNKRKRTPWDYRDYRDCPGTVPLSQNDFCDVYTETLFAPALRLGRGAFSHHTTKNDDDYPASWVRLSGLEGNGVIRLTPYMLIGSSVDVFDKAGCPAVDYNLAQAKEAVHYPFLAAETGYSWVSIEQQCLLSCVSCSSIAGKFNDRIRSKTNQPGALDDIAFGLVMTHMTGTIYISWRMRNRKPRVNFKVRLIDSFNIFKPEEYLKLRMCIFNIFKWAEEREERLAKILGEIYTKGEGSKAET